MMDFPKHLALTLSHNDHKTVHDTLRDEIERDPDAYQWVSDEQRAKAIAADDVWTIQWYPWTPVSFYRLAAHDLGVLLAAAARLGREG